MAKLEEPKKTGVPDIVIDGAPSFSVVPSMASAV